MKNQGDYKREVEDLLIAINHTLPFRKWVFVKDKGRYILWEDFREYEVMSWSGPKPAYDWLCGFWHRVYEEKK